MEMCPYCGEEVAANVAKCWKCGTELSEGGASGGSESDELEVPDDDDAGSKGKSPRGAKGRKGKDDDESEDADDEGDDGEGKPGPVVDCPFCKAPTPKKSKRCKECGRVVNEVVVGPGASLWKYGVLGLVVVLGLGGAYGVYSVSMKRRRSELRARNSLNVRFEDLLAKMQPFVKVTEKRKEVWTKDFDKKYVKWTGMVTETPDGNRVKLSHTKETAKPDCLVEFSDEDEGARGLQVGATVVYSARLTEFGKDGFAFTLDDAKVEK